MDKLLRMNPGLPRRFPDDNRIHFPNFRPDELSTILLRMLRSQGCTWIAEFEQTAAAVTKRLYDDAEAARDRTFGNAGAMRNLADAVKRRWAVRVDGDSTQPVRPEDIPAGLLAAVRSGPVMPSFTLAGAHDRGGGNVSAPEVTA